MNREEILQDLASAGREPLSGQIIADRHGVSRNAVWKAIRILQKEGYPIIAEGRKGYTLRPGSDILNAAEIRTYLDDSCSDMDIFVHATIDSTNTEAKRSLYFGYKKEALILSETQSKGTGRNDHTFYSPPCTGLYFTMLLRSDIDIALMPAVSRAAGVAVCRAVRSVTGKEISLRGVNDLYLNGKKVGGILSEAFSPDLEAERVTILIIGIGLNITTQSFPEDIRSEAGSLMTDCSRNRLAAEIAVQFKSLDLNDEKSILPEYEQYYA